MRLNLRNKILLFLYDFVEAKSAPQVPNAITQAGISTAMGVRLNNLGRVIHPLVTDGLVIEETRHILAGKRRKRAYFLTSDGITLARDLVAKIEDEPLETGPGSNVFLPQLRDEFGPQYSNSELVLMADVKKANLHQVHLFPERDIVIDREEILAKITTLLDQGQAVTLHGLGGIGKTTLAAHIASHYQDRRDLLWWTGGPLDTCTGFLHFVGNYLKRRGKPVVLSLLEEGEEVIERVAYTAVGAIEELAPILIIDEGESIIDTQLKHLITTLLGALPILAVSRTPYLPSTRTQEIRLEGLGEPDAIDLVKHYHPKCGDGTCVQIARRCGGHPLAMRLSEPGKSWDLMAQEQLFRFVRKEVLSQLEPGQQEMIELASMFLVPVHRLDAFQKLPDATAMEDLVDKGFFTAAGDDVALHPLLTSYFRGSLARPRTQQLHREAAAYYEDRLEIDPAGPLLVQHHLLGAGEHEEAVHYFDQYEDEVLQYGEVARGILEQYPLDKVPKLERIRLLLALASSNEDEKERKALLSRLSVEIETSEDSRVPLWSARAAQMTGDSDAALDHLLRALDRAEDLTKFEIARLNNNVGFHLKARQRASEATQHLTTARELFLEARSEYGTEAMKGEAAAVFNLARIMGEQDRWGEAEKLAEDAKLLSREAGLHLRNLTVRRFIAECRRRQGDLEAAERITTELINEAERNGAREEEGRGRLMLARILSQTDHSEEAEEQKRRGDMLLVVVDEWRARLSNPTNF